MDVCGEDWHKKRRQGGLGRVNNSGGVNELRIKSIPPTSSSASALAAARFEWYPPEDLAARAPYEHFVLYSVPMTFPWLLPSSIKKIITCVESGQEEAQGENGGL